MALEKRVTHDCSVLEDGQIQVREIARIFEDGVFTGHKTYHRHVVDVGDDVSGEPQIIQDVVQNLHTPARVSSRASERARLATERAARGQ